MQTSIDFKGTANVPLEVQENVASFTDGYTCCVLGLDMSLLAIRQCLFWSGGPGAALTEILAQGGDHRALFTIKELVPAQVAIAKAVQTKNKGLLLRVMTLWGSSVSDGGLKLALEWDLEWGVHLIQPSFEQTIRYRNAFYVSKGGYDSVDKIIPDPYGEVYAIHDRSRFREILNQCQSVIRAKVMAKCGTAEDILEELKPLSRADRYFLLRELPRSASLQTVIDVYNNIDRDEDVAWLFREDLTKSAIMSLSRGSPREKALQDLLTTGFTTSSSMLKDPIRIARVLIAEGMEETLLEYLENFSLDIDCTDLLDLMSAVGHEKVTDGRWEMSLGTALVTCAPELIRRLHRSDQEDAAMFLLENGYEVAGVNEFIAGMRVDLPCRYAQRLEEKYGDAMVSHVQGMIPETVEEAIWLVTEASRHYKMKEGDTYLCMFLNTVCIPKSVDMNPNIAESGYLWLMIADMVMCASMVWSEDLNIRRQPCTDHSTGDDD